MATAQPPAQGAIPAEPISALAELIERYRPASRPLRRLVALLTDEPLDLSALVQRSALPRQTVETVLAAIADDLVHDDATVAIRAARVDDYRRRFGYSQLTSTELADPLAQRLTGAASLAREMADLAGHAPRARADLDHVPATAETVVRRALWLDSTYDLAGATLLCVGDHDLTSLAVGQVSPAASIVVVDIDEPTLEFIDAQASRLGLKVRCLVADLRFGLPGPAIGCADLVFTDPPYTPEGVGLFTGRGLQGLGNRDNGRVIVAYGYSDRHPTLGFQTQSVAHRLGLAYESLLPAFNRYDGAQAVGSASGLYVWRPTSRTWRGLDRFLADTETNIYTRGMQALEQSRPAHDAVPPAVCRVTGEAGFPIRILVGDGWGRAGGNAARLRLGTLLSAGIPARMAAAGPFAVVADLSADPGAWLLRVLLAANAGRVAALVSASHPDVGSEAGQRALAEIAGPKYDLRFLPGQPDGKHAIVVATAVDATALGAGGRLASRLLHRAHGKVGNVWREGLIDVHRERGLGPLTKRAARAAVAAHAPSADVLEACLIDLPRHQIVRLLRAAGASAEGPA